MTDKVRLTALAHRLEDAHRIKAECITHGFHATLIRGLGATGPFQWDVAVPQKEWHRADAFLYGSHFHADHDCEDN